MSAWIAAVLAITAIVLAGSRLVKNNDERRDEKQSYEKGQSFPIKKRRRQ